MDDNKYWGCIGIVLYWLIAFVYTESLLIIFGIILAIIVVAILVYSIHELIIRYLSRKLRIKRKKYPHAYYIFFRKVKYQGWEEDLSIKEMREILSFSKIEWEKREEIELERTLRVEQTLTEYNKIRNKYPEGFACWEKEHPSACMSETVNNLTEIRDFDSRQKEFLIAEKWEQAQNTFSKLCRSKITAMPHSGCYFYNINFQKTDYKGDTIQGEYCIWQFFFSGFCTATDLDYTHFGRIQRNNNNIEKYKEGEIDIPFYYGNEIVDFIKSLDKSVQIITVNENTQVQMLICDLGILGFQTSYLQVNELSSNYVVIIDGVTTQQQFTELCESIIHRFETQKPCIVYISLMKEYSRDEMQALIDKRNLEMQQQEQIQNEIESISRALKSADIESAKEKIQEIKNFALSSKVDKELLDAINKVEEKVKNDYAIGLVDDYELQYVDYFIPSFAQDRNNWKYPVTKYPERGCVVFPYRRKIINRRGFSEVKFQNYLQNIFKECDLLILGDCNILPVENNRPFEPDIAIICKKYPSIRIDIEIDEPYAAYTRAPIHYIGYGDDFRDVMLNNIGWIVIRFTEYQVFSNPKECAALIAQILHNIQPAMILPINILSHSTPKEIERWTEIEAKVMASENIREKYLDHEFGVVDNEELEVTDIKQTEKEKLCAKSVKPLIIEHIHREKMAVADKFVVCERDNKIQFLPQEHIYLYNGQEQFVPVSSVISCFFKPFDSYYWSAYKANQQKVSQGQILEEWNAKGACSREVGTFMHQQIENFYKGLIYQQEYTFKYSGKYVHIEEEITLEVEYMQFQNFLKSHNFRPFRIEWAIYDEELRIAGTIDMIHKRGDVFDIYDWKRSHRITDIYGRPITENNYGDKGLGELNNIDDTPYWHYCIQQNLYRYILEKKYNMKVEKMYMIVFGDDIIEYRKLEIPYMGNTIDSIVKALREGFVKKRLLLLYGESSYN